jgi:hypothetical protein
MAAAPVAGADRGMSAPRRTMHRPPWVERVKLKPIGLLPLGPEFDTT